MKFATIAAILVATLISWPSVATASTYHGCDTRPAKTLCLIHWHVKRVHNHQAKLHHSLVPYGWVAEAHPARRLRILDSWQASDAAWRHRYNQARASFTVAIAHVFGPYSGQARAVCGCEGCSVGSTNGQYLGGFQMGSHERATYAYGYRPVSGYRNALQQTWAAWRYFVASGRDWSPWQCQP